MKVIDLLNKIANGEEVPNKIIYRNVPMIYDSGTEDYTPHQTDKFHGNDLFHYLFEEETKIFLNDEVEIIEEDKKIDKDIKWYFIESEEQEKTKIAQINMNFKILREKLTEIIDKLNEG